LNISWSRQGENLRKPLRDQAGTAHHSSGHAAHRSQARRGSQCKGNGATPDSHPTYLQSEPKMNGPAVQLSVAWTQEGKRKEVPVEDWILNLETNHPMTNGPWTYNGSMIQDGVFLADQEFSIVSVVTDPTALVNNPRKGYDNNGIWQIRDDVVPPLDTPVEISITLTETSSRPNKTMKRFTLVLRFRNQTKLMDRTRITDLYFAEARSKLIDVAAFLDRSSEAKARMITG